MNPDGVPVNARPLSVKEAGMLAKSLKVTGRKKKETPFLTPAGLMGNHILHLDPQKGRAIWYTKPKPRQLHFTERLGIPDGIAQVPAMLWLAGRNRLCVFALRHHRRPGMGTKLYNAPFFNVYENGSVCMGDVDVKIKDTASLEAFTASWESYFFGSYFSHLMESYNPIDGNCVSLWQGLVGTDRPFPNEVLKPNRLTLQNLLQ